MLRYFEGLVDPYAGEASPERPSPRLWPFIRDYSSPFTRLFAAATFMSVLVAAAEIGLIWYVGRLVDLLQAGPEGFFATHGFELIAVAVFVLLLRPVLQGLDVVLLNNAILPNYATRFRWRSHSHVLRQSVGWFENDFAGRIANRIMQTPPAAGEAIFQVFDAITYALAYMAGAAVLLGQADPRLMVPLLVWLLLYGLLVRWTVRRVGPASKAASDARSEVTGRVVDSYSNIHSVKMFAHHEMELDYAREAIERARSTFQTEMRIYTIMDVALVTLNGLLIAGVTGWALWLWSQGLATAGIVAAACALTLRLNAMTGWIMWALTSFFRNLGVVAEGMETIAQPISITDAPGAPALNLSEGRIRFDQVSHHYGRGSGGLDRLSLTIEPGEKIGLVGRSGAGKSTLIKLLLRFYEAESGRIEIDGQDISLVTQASLRSHIAMVAQDSSLLHRSIRDNIRYGRPGASDDEVREAARRAEALEFIGPLTDAAGRSGLDAHVGERGVKLSGGQRQRITLARAMLKDAPILVLDEATSALDSEAEAAVQETLYGMMDGRTVIAIAHRLSTVARMDRIVVLDQGRIAEEGTHDGLLRQGGLYAGFWSRQSGGFLTTKTED